MPVTLLYKISLQFVNVLTPALRAMHGACAIALARTASARTARDYSFRLPDNPSKNCLWKRRKKMIGMMMAINPVAIMAS